MPPTKRSEILRVSVGSTVTEIPVCWTREQVAAVAQKYAGNGGAVDLLTMLETPTFGTDRERRWLARCALRRLADVPAELLEPLRLFATTRPAQGEKRRARPAPGLPPPKPDKAARPRVQTLRESLARAREVATQQLSAPAVAASRPSGRGTRAAGAPTTSPRPLTPAGLPPAAAAPSGAAAVPAAVPVAELPAAVVAELEQTRTKIRAELDQHASTLRAALEQQAGDLSTRTAELDAREQRLAEREAALSSQQGEPPAPPAGFGG